MKTYPTLYSRTSTGATQIWYCQQEKNGKYRSISGQLDGVKTFSEFTQAEPKNIGKKNETNAEKQAELEIQAKYKRQLKSGGYFENIKDIDKKLFISPMLAHKWEDRSDEINWKNGNYISPKMDGIRCIINKDGAFSRNGEKFVSFPHILEQLKVLFNDNPDLVLDGEIYCDKLCNDFNKIISLARKTKPKKEDLEESKKFIQYWIFDSPSLQGGFHERYDKLITICLYYFLNNQYVKLCKHKLIYKVGEIEKNLCEYLEKGFEGLMLNTYDGEYENKRSKNILKYKKFQDNEYEIIDIVEGCGNRTGMFGYAVLKIEDKTFRANARGNEDFYKNLLKDKNKYIGKKATVRYQNLTPEGIPRFPVIVDFNRTDL